MCLRITTHLYPLISTHSLAQKQAYPQKPDSHSGELALPTFTSVSVIQPHPFHLMATYSPGLSLPPSTTTMDQQAPRTRDDAHVAKGLPRGNRDASWQRRHCHLQFLDQQPTYVLNGLLGSHTYDQQQKGTDRRPFHHPPAAASSGPRGQPEPLPLLRRQRARCKHAESSRASKGT